MLNTETCPSGSKWILRNADDPSQDLEYFFMGFHEGKHPVSQEDVRLAIVLQPDGTYVTYAAHWWEYWSKTHLDGPHQVH